VPGRRELELAADAGSGAPAAGLRVGLTIFAGLMLRGLGAGEIVDIDNARLEGDGDAQRLAENLGVTATHSGSPKTLE
jgi:hypothetical protein